jgi:hypothetical protein
MPGTALQGRDALFCLEHLHGGSLGYLVHAGLDGEEDRVGLAVVCDSSFGG